MNRKVLAAFLFGLSAGSGVGYVICNRTLTKIAVLDAKRMSNYRLIVDTFKKMEDVMGNISLSGLEREAKAREFEAFLEMVLELDETN